ncbi:hypothetical protein AYI68_g3942 [Smittium mucronatum]|uniref:Uncharacterized protein n=1 Tax=Smittium mucronatum TaxID=133383 RepID=A0A1R0GYM1_9FUNG|nr:hypothetical protein AYI68_g3942 [Smittium mucronatum]
MSGELYWEKTVDVAGTFPKHTEIMDDDGDPEEARNLKPIVMEEQAESMERSIVFSGNAENKHIYCI